MNTPNQINAIKIYEVNNCLIDLSLREVVVNNEAFRPDQDTFDTLVYLIEQRDHIIDNDEFRRVLWKDGDVTEYEIARCVMNARKAILDDQSQALIHYCPKQEGYQFTGEVLELEFM